MYNNVIEASSSGVDFKPKLTVPTDARPGSNEKIDVMCQRVSRGEQIHHAEDPKFIHSIDIGIRTVEACLSRGNYHNGYSI